MSCTAQLQLDIYAYHYVAVRTMIFGITLLLHHWRSDGVVISRVSNHVYNRESVGPPPPPPSSTSVVTCVLGPGPAPVLSPVEAPLPETRHEAPRSPRPGHRLRRRGRRHRGGGVDTEGQASVLPVQHRAVPQRGVRHHRHQRQGGGLHHQLGVHGRGGHRLREMRLRLRR